MKMNKKFVFETSTDNLGFNNICTYWGFWGGDGPFDSYYIKTDFEEGYIEFNIEYFYYHFQSDKLKDSIVKSINEVSDILLESLENAGLTCIESVNCTGVYSPRQYNFGGDRFWLDFEIIDSEKLIKELRDLLKNNNHFSKFLKDNYTSYDGFMSFTANNIDQWVRDLYALESNSLSAAFSYLLSENLVVENFGFCVYENWHENNFYTEFLDYFELESCIDDLKKGTFVSGSYTGIDSEMENKLVSKYIELEFDYMKGFEASLSNLIELYGDSLGGFDFEGYLRAKFDEIEKHNLKLF